MSDFSGIMFLSGYTYAKYKNRVKLNMLGGCRYLMGKLLVETGWLQIILFILVLLLFFFMSRSEQFSLHINIISVFLRYVKI